MADLDGLVEAALAGRKGRRVGDEIRFLCPAHDDNDPSADWNRKKGVWNCMPCGAHGNTEDLARRLGVPIPEKRPKADWQEVAHWDFTDEEGNVLYRHVKFLVGNRKQFQFWRPDGQGGWIRNREGVKPVLYRLPALVAAPADEVVWLPEGEKDADSLGARGLLATSTSDGAQERPRGTYSPARQRWYPERYNDYLRGRRVALVPDNDQAGRDFMEFVAASLQGVARSVKVVDLSDELEPKGDVTDWLFAGGSVAELVARMEAAPEWKPVAEKPAEVQFPLTDAGNGELFAHRYGDRVRYDWQRGRWLVWGRHRWQQDPNGELHRLAKEAARERWRLAADEEGGRREAIGKWAVASESEARLNAALSRARSEPPIADEGQGWDAQPGLLACDNGVVNLVTGEMRAGRPEDRLTMGSSLPYDPRAECPRWERFLEEVLPDAAVREFVRLAIGYSLTGLAREQVWFLCYGTGANGKGTLFDVLRWVMGDLAHVMAFSTIERGKEQSIASDMAALQGKRLVVTSETQEHSRFNEARIKSLTGEDAITARELYQRQFTFEPVLKLWVGVNHKPTVTDDSYGFWRRVRLIPFTQTFDDARRDDGLREALKRELPGVLAWCVRAAMDWAKHGLPVPPAIAVATVEYREESDPLAAFMTERCAVREDAEVGASALYRAYKGWAEAQGMREREVMSATFFGRRMGERFKRMKNRTNNAYVGIGLLSDGWAKPSTGGGFVEGLGISEGFLAKSSELLRSREGDFPERHPNPPHPPPVETGSEKDCGCDSCGCPDEACSVREDGGGHCDEHHPVAPGHGRKKYDDGG